MSDDVGTGVGITDTGKLELGGATTVFEGDAGAGIADVIA